jgi:hypothetical protein
MEFVDFCAIKSIFNKTQKNPAGCCYKVLENGELVYTNLCAAMSRVAKFGDLDLNTLAQLIRLVRSGEYAVASVYYVSNLNLEKYQKATGVAVGHATTLASLSQLVGKLLNPHKTYFRALILPLKPLGPWDRRRQLGGGELFK